MPVIKAVGAMQDNEDRIVVVKKRPAIKKDYAGGRNVIRINDAAWSCVKEIERLSGAPLSQIASTLIIFAYQNAVEVVDWDYEFNEEEER